MQTHPLKKVAICATTKTGTEKGGKYSAFALKVI